MSIIPLDVHRRCEQRWAARFVRQAPERSSEKSGHESRSTARRAVRSEGVMSTLRQLPTRKQRDPEQHHRE
jgi:hypothetical protein